MKNLTSKSFFLAGSLLLAACSLGTSNSSNADTVNPTMAKEVASLSLLVGGSSSAPAGLKRVFLSDGPFEIDATDPTKTLTGFENFSFSKYTVSVVSETSDRADYTNKETITYTLPSGESATATLYFGVVTTTNSVEASSASEEAPSSTTSEDVTSAPSSLLEKKGYGAGSKGGMFLHGNGYGDGSCGEMLSGNYSFENQDGAVTFNRFEGLAVVEGNEYSFIAETLEGTRKGKTFTRSSFSLIYSETSYLTVEEATVSDGSSERNVYVYTSVKEGVKTHYLLEEGAKYERLVYKTDYDKAAINRFEYNGDTYFTLHIKEAGTMSLVGVYNKVLTTAEDGTVTVSYQKIAVSSFAHAPVEK